MSDICHHHYERYTRSFSPKCRTCTEKEFPPSQWTLFKRKAMTCYEWCAFWFFQIVFPRLIFFGVWSFCFYGVYRAVRG